MWIGIDDKRDLKVDVLCRTYDAGLRMLQHPIEWDGMVFDGDLGPGDGDGYDLMQYAADQGKLAKYVQIVTDNPVTLQRMQDLLHAEGYKKVNPRSYTRR